MKFTRLLTAGLSSPLEGIVFTPRSSRLTKLDGSVVFEMNGIMAPEGWDQSSVDILAQKYFRRKGCDHYHQNSLYNSVYSKSITAECPSLLEAYSSGLIDSETDARQVFHRLAGCWTMWGEREGYFTSKDDAQVFYDELVRMLALQMCAPNSPQWFNTGLHYAYGISGPAQGHSYVDHETGELRRSTSAYERPQPHACFIQSVSDDLVNEGGIMDLLTREARIFKYGSGTGSNFSKIRGENEPLSGGGKSSGLMSFLAVGDRAAGAIKSGGTTRRAAKMVRLDMDHPDIEAFIMWKVLEERKVAMLAAGSRLIAKHWNAMCEAVEANGDANPKTNEKLRKVLSQAKRDGVIPGMISQCVARLQAGDHRRDISELTASWDGDAYLTVGGMNSNNSVGASAPFMHAVVQDKPWYLVNRTNKKTKEVPARDLWDKINYAAWACADPGLQYDTTINDWHTCPADGRINASNPCSEYFFLDDTACNLASLNLVPFLTMTDDLTHQSVAGFDVEAFVHAVRIWTTVLEISVTMAQFPSEMIAQLSYDFRALGLGFANLGGMVMRMGLPYDSQEAQAWGASISALMTGTAYATSAEMAAEFGAFAGFERNREHMLRVIWNHRVAATGDGNYVGLSVEPWTNLQGAELVALHKAHHARNLMEVVKNARASWVLAYNLGQEHGYRNAQVTVLAPTGTIGILMGCDTTGVEPDFALVKFKKLAGGGYMKLVNSALPTALAGLGYTDAQIKAIEGYVVGRDLREVFGQELVQSGGYSTQQVEEWATALSTAFDPSYVLPVSDLNEKFGVDTIKNVLMEVGGRSTVEGAPYLSKEHYAVFDCANKCGSLGTRYISPMGHLRMMAAAQPFLSGAISKTVNLPNEYTVEQIGEVYTEAWKMMIKAVALYRDGSKFSQAIATNLDLLDGVDVEEVEAAPVATKVEVVAQAAAQQVVKASRRKMPNRRGGYTQGARIGDTKIYLRTGEFEDGSLGEIFLDGYKEGAGFKALLNAFAVAVSMGLQHGVPLEEFCDAFLFTKFEPHGLVRDHAAIKTCTSLIDYIFRDLAITYLSRYDLSAINPEELLSEAGVAHPLAVPASKGQTFGIDPDEVVSATTLEEHATLARPTTTKLTPVAESRAKGYTGDPCPSCGHLTLVRNGSCMKCTTCGGTTGCS